MSVGYLKLHIKTFKLVELSSARKDKKIENRLAHYFRMDYQ